MKVPLALTAREVAELCVKKFSRGNPSEDYQNYGLMMDGSPNPIWLDESTPLAAVGLSNNDTLIFKSKNQFIVFKFVDNSTRRLSIDTTIPVSGAILQILQQVGFVHTSGYALKHDKTPASEGWLAPELSLTDQGVSPDGTLLVVKPAFDFSTLKLSQDLSQESPLELHILYTQATKFITSGAIPVCFDEAMQLAALQTQEQFGSHHSEAPHPASLPSASQQPDSSPAPAPKGNTVILASLILSPLWQCSHIAEHEILKRYRRLQGVTQTVAKAQYLALCGSLTPYEIAYYTAKEDSATGQVVPSLFGLTFDSLFRFNPTTKRVRTHFPLSRLKRWKLSKSPEGITFDFADFEEGLLTIHTPNGKEISDKIAAYIDVILTKRKNDTRAATSEAFGSGLVRARVGQLNTFTIQSRDANQNNKIEGGDIWKVLIVRAPNDQQVHVPGSRPLSASMTNLALPSSLTEGETQSPEAQNSSTLQTGILPPSAKVTDNADGTYSVAYTVYASGNYLVSINLGKPALKGSPFVVPARADADPTRCVVSGTGATSAVAGETAMFKVIARDRVGDRIVVGGDDVVASFEGCADNAHVKDNNDGTYSISYNISAAATYTLAVTINGEAILDSPFRVTVAPARLAPMRCQVFGSAASNAVAGEGAAFTVSARDVFGNTLTTGGSKFLFVLTGPLGNPTPTDTPGSVVDLEDGTYDVAYSLTRAGQYTGSLTTLGEHVGGSPFTLTVSPGDIHPSACSASSPVLASGTTAGQNFVVNIEARDRWHNLVPVSGAEFTAFLAPAAASTTAAPSPLVVTECETPGLYQLSAMLTQVGVWNLSVSLAGLPLAGSPFPINVHPGAVHPSSCTLSLSPTVIAGELNRAILHCRDLHSNVVDVPASRVDASLIVNASSPVQIVHQSDTTCALSFSVLVVAPGEALVVKVDGHPIAGSPFPLKVAAGPAFGPNTVAFGEGLFGGIAGQQSTFIIRPKDRHSNNTKASSSDFRVEVTGWQLLQGNMQALLDETHQVSYIAPVAGKYLISVTHAGLPILGSPFTSVVTDPGAISEHHSRLMLMDRLAVIEQKLDSLLALQRSAQPE
eukprot:TRINITY_DN2742_c0_g1_i2.p1 TRINITY_DN2742_c0_g1~~TRINITY_DN2742_c0_g1_i2.p1  ORF type:complete len:1110 (-),score=206.78 TRINITY_DN2742_c0_g1_i2:46-3297(-)